VLKTITFTILKYNVLSSNIWYNYQCFNTNSKVFFFSIKLYYITKRKPIQFYDFNGGEIMKKVSILILVLFIITFNLVACTNKDTTTGGIKVEDSSFKSGSDDSNYVELQKVNDNIWIHTTYTNYDGKRTASNGIIAVTSKGIILVDTPWNNAQTRELISLTKIIFKKDISIAVITHAHEDRIGGIDTLIENKIDVRSTSLTAKEAEKKGFKKPRTEFESDSKITLGDTNIEVFYPGEGHTIDNTVVWFPQHKVLFGGCIIKSLESTSIGNIEEANVKQWSFSVEKLLERYSDAKVVIPGHGKSGGIDLINHTLDLLKNFN
jgi:metallo-beta-lactamase class B